MQKDKFQSELWAQKPHELGKRMTLCDSMWSACPTPQVLYLIPSYLFRVLLFTHNLCDSEALNI